MVPLRVNEESFHRVENSEQDFVISRQVLISLALAAFREYQAALRRRLQYFYSLNQAVGLIRRKPPSVLGYLSNHPGQTVADGFYLLSKSDGVNKVYEVAKEQR